MVYSVVSRPNHSLTHPTYRLPVQLRLLRPLWLEGGDDAHNGATLATVLEMGWGVRWGWDRPVFMGPIPPRRPPLKSQVGK